MAQILVIDDDEHLCSIMAEILNHAGHKVLEAHDGRQGIKQLRARGADLVITDLIMPEKEGIETILEIRRDFPAVKVMAISGAPKSRKYLEVAAKLGATRVLEKPFAVPELLTAVAAVLEGT